MKNTIYDKIWNDHLIHLQDDGSSLLFVDRHLVHEVTSPQAFEGLRNSNRNVRQPSLTLAVADHNVPTTDRTDGISDAVSQLQVTTLDQNCKEFGITEYDMNDPRQGIVHVIGPEQGATLPGMTIVCGDSHTATHGAFGALSFGIGTSEVEHVLATQCLVSRKMHKMRITIDGELRPGVGAKDLILAIIGKIGTSGGTGCAIEFSGSAVRALSMESRMTLCNMTIEAGARCGIIAVDEVTIDYLENRTYTPKGEQWVEAKQLWSGYVSDKDAVFDREIKLDGQAITPQVTWGTSPEMVIPIDGVIPDPQGQADETRRDGWVRALEYMDLESGTPINEVKVDKVFIGSCTNGRIEDLRAAAQVARGHSVASNVSLAMVVPGSGLVKRQAEAEGLDVVFTGAGFEWREPGCSMCLAMNADRLEPGERCASTSNRNFEGRQGQGGRTHLVSPAMAAAAAVAGHFVDPAELEVRS